MSDVFSYFRRFDWALVLPPVILAGLGLLSIYSSSALAGDFLNFKKQIIFVGLGVLLMVGIGFLDFRPLRTNSYLLFTLYILGILSLIGILFLGTVIRGVRGWYRVGPFSFDPVPLVALILIFILAKYFSRYHIEIYKLWHLFFSFLYVFLPALLILAQPDLGSSICLLFVWLGVIIFSGIKIRHFLLLAILFVIVLSLSWLFFLRDYQKARIITFLNPETDPRGAAWNVNQSKIAIGAGGLWGKGFGGGSQARYGFLPEAQTDFIFPALAEETGFLGVSLILLLYGILFWRAIILAKNSRSNFAKLFCLGFVFLLISRTFVNIGMSLGLLPIVGIPLPFVSYGGSELLALFLGLGLLQSIRVHRG